MHTHSQNFLIFFLISFFLSGQVLASGRYPSDVVPEPHTRSDDQAKCLCDPTSDPCCIPPLGGSSTKTEAPNNKNTDTASCKCDPVADPCCKRLPGTQNKDK